MALRIMIAGILAAVFGAIVAVAMGSNLGSALIVYGIFGVCGGVLACLASLPMMRNLAPHKAAQDRTLG